MSMLTFLFFASLVYFAAADPIAESAPKAPSDQDKVNSFMEAISSAYDEYISTVSIMTSLSKGDSDYMKTTTLDGVGSFINFCLYTAQQQSESGTFSQKDDNDFILMQFDTLDSSSFPAVPYQDTPVPCPKEAPVATS